VDEGRLSLESKDIGEEKRQELLRLFPEAQTEGGKIDFDQLKRALGESVDPGRERYGMTWPGKADCFRLIQSPSTATLLPVREESVRFDETENMIIEGDNLEVLKLLQKGYQNKIKMIYIDPPYNTGNDFIYPDDFADNLKNYLQYTGQVDPEGKLFSNNLESDGRFHSKWLNMMYPRLYLARNLLRDDGVIFISIDENELDNLRKICSEVFGESNHIEDLVWAQNTTHSQSPLYSTNHEYVVVYAKSAPNIHSDSGAFREPKAGYEEIRSLVQTLNPLFPPLSEIDKKLRELVSKHRKDYEEELVLAGLALDEDTERQDPWRGIYAYKYVEYRDDQGEIVPDSKAASRNALIRVWRIDNASAPAGKQAASTRDKDSPNYRFYNPLHPTTGRPCPHPKTGWRWPRSWQDSSRESFEGLDRKGLIYWGKDETTIPQYKRFLDDVETNVSKSFFYDYTDGEKQVTGLLGRAALFPNPKPTTLTSRLISQVCVNGDIILDFFAGSGTLAQSVLEVSKSLSLMCHFILVQLPEPIDGTTKDQAAAAEFCDQIGRPRTIAEITKERVRRVSEQLYRNRNAAQGQLALGRPAEDLGFRVLKLARSNFKVWEAHTDEGVNGVERQMELAVNHIMPDRTAEDIFYEILMKSEYPLTAKVENFDAAGIPAFSVEEDALIICVERKVTAEAVAAIATRSPSKVIFLDEAFSGNDQLKANAKMNFESAGVKRFETV
jgi:adenine-specific DNA-methyltransferase